MEGLVVEWLSDGLTLLINTHEPSRGQNVVTDKRHPAELSRIPSNHHYSCTFINSHSLFLELEFKSIRAINVASSDASSQKPSKATNKKPCLSLSLNLTVGKYRVTSNLTYGDWLDRDGLT